MNYKITRRHFSQCLGRSTAAFGATTVLGLSSLYSRADGAVSVAPKNPATETLVQYAYLMLPVLEPTHTRYRAVADKVSLQASQVPAIASLMEGGIAALNATDKGLWLNQPLEERVSIISDLAGTPFFNYLHWVTSEIVMRDPGLWEKLGYQGSAIEHGGYLHRGFDDIDWLPPAEAAVLK